MCVHCLPAKVLEKRRIKRADCNFTALHVWSWNCNNVKFRSEWSRLKRVFGFISSDSIEVRVDLNQQSAQMQIKWSRAANTDKIWRETGVNFNDVLLASCFINFSCNVSNKSLWCCRHHCERMVVSWAWSACGEMWKYAMYCHCLLRSTLWDSYKSIFSVFLNQLLLLALIRSWALSIRPKIPELSKRGQTVQKFPGKVYGKSELWNNANHSTKKFGNVRSIIK